MDPQDLKVWQDLQDPLEIEVHLDYLVPQALLEQEVHQVPKENEVILEVLEKKVLLDLKVFLVHQVHLGLEEKGVKKVPLENQDLQVIFDQRKIKVNVFLNDENSNFQVLEVDLETRDLLELLV